MIKAFKTTIPLVVATHATIATVAGLSYNGRLLGVKIKAPAAVDTSATTKVDIKDADGDILYSKAGIAAAATNQAYIDANNQPLQLPMAGSFDLVLTMSATQATNRSVDVTLLIDTSL